MCQRETRKSRHMKVWCLVSLDDYVPYVIGICATEEIAEHEKEHNPDYWNYDIRIEEWDVTTEKCEKDK